MESGMTEERGRIIKAISGFYYVYDHGGSGIYACRAKGLFRKEGRKPLVGDEVLFSVTDTRDMEGNVTELLPRKSALLRPPVANVDQALLIFAVRSPKPNFNLLDRFLIHMAEEGVETILCFNKTDLAERSDREELQRIYRGAGCRILFVSGKKEEGIDELKEALRGRITAAAGPSGVGKSTIINAVQGSVRMETGEISRKIERGKHTTRHVELIPLTGEEGFILDTPGFSSLILPEIGKEELSGFYPEFGEYVEKCRFQGCSHIPEPDCGVKEAVEAGEISLPRYENYKLLYEELAQRRNYG